MKHWFYTIRGRYITMIAAIMVVALLTASGLSTYFTHTFRNQEMESQQTLLGIYTQQLESTMDAVRRFAVNIVSQNGTFDDMQYLPDEDEQIIAKLELAERMRTFLIQYLQAECVFAYSSHSNDFLYLDQKHLTYPERVELRGDILNWIQIDSENLSGDWHVHTSGNRQYLVYLYHDETAYAGCAMLISDMLQGVLNQKTVSAAALLKGESVLDTVGDIFNFVSDPTMLLSSGYFTRNRHTYYIAVSALGETGYSIAKLHPSDSQMSSLMYTSLWIIALFMAAVVPTILAVSTFSFTRPVHALVDVMDQVAEGDLDARVPIENLSTLQEFRQIGESYNRSLEQISLLSNENLEKQKAYQKAQLNALQMQINPHFLMNSLNIMYTASCAKKSRIVQEMCLHLSSYYRYSMASNRNLVPLAEEVRFTEDYLHIMKLRFENAFSYEVAVPPFLKTALVPPMVLKTFVENSVKYAVKPQRSAELFIWAELLSEGDNARLKLVIEDSGPGYPAEMLGEMEDIFRYDTAKHTGIRNVYDRIRLLFGKDAHLSLESRKGGGARVRILLPVRMEEENVSGAADR